MEKSDYITPGGLREGAGMFYLQDPWTGEHNKTTSLWLSDITFLLI